MSLCLLSFRACFLQLSCVCMCVCVCFTTAFCLFLSSSLVFFFFQLTQNAVVQTQLFNGSRWSVCVGPLHFSSFDCLIVNYDLPFFFFRGVVQTCHFFLPYLISLWFTGPSFCCCCSLMLKIWVFLSYHLIASALFSPPPYCRSLVFLFVLAHKAPLIYMLLFFPSLSPIFTVSFVTLLSSIRRQCRFQRMVTSRSNQPPPRIGRREEKKGWLERVVRTERENKSTIFFFLELQFYSLYSFLLHQCFHFKKRRT